MTDDEGHKLLREFYRRYPERRSNPLLEDEPEPDFDFDSLPTEAFEAPKPQISEQELQSIDELFDFDLDEDEPETNTAAELIGSMPLSEDDANRQLDAFYEEIATACRSQTVYCDAKTRDIVQELVEDIYSLADEIAPVGESAGEAEELLKLFKQENTYI